MTSIKAGSKSLITIFRKGVLVWNLVRVRMSVWVRMWLMGSSFTSTYPHSSYPGVRLYLSQYQKLHFSEAVICIAILKRNKGN